MTLIRQCLPTSVHQHCEDLRSSLGDKPGLMDVKEGWREREREKKKEIEKVSESEKSVQSVQLDDDDDDHEESSLEGNTHSLL